MGLFFKPQSSGQVLPREEVLSKIKVTRKIQECLDSGKTYVSKKFVLVKTKHYGWELHMNDGTCFLFW